MSATTNWTIPQEREDLELELQAIEREIQRRRWKSDPPLWAKERLGEFLWSKQRDIAQSVCDNRRTAVHSCHEAGKSYIASRIVAWWLDVHEPGEAFVVTSATTGEQVKTVLWREINRAQAKGLKGRTNLTEWHMMMPSGKEEIVAFGRKPSEYNPSAFHGIHARYVLVVFDEACGIPGGTSDNPFSLWEAADSLIANDNGRFLAIGNPDYPGSEFAKVCSPGSGWNVIGISAFDTPNFTGEAIPEELRDVLIGHIYVDEKKKKWGETNPLYVSKVLGDFPKVTRDGLIPMQWVRAAQLRDLTPKTDAEKEAALVWVNELGVDVGGGGDKNVVAHRTGPIVRIRRRDNEPDTMKSCGRLLMDLDATQASVAKVDEIGMGKGLVDRAKEQGRPVMGINVGREAKDKEHFINLRAEGYWGLRERFEDGTVDIDENDDDLAAQLVEIKFHPTSAGKIQIESKKDMKRRGISSPDDADAVMLAFLDTERYQEPEVRLTEMTWG